MRRPFKKQITYLPILFAFTLMPLSAWADETGSPQSAAPTQITEPSKTPESAKVAAPSQVTDPTKAAPSTKITLDEAIKKAKESFPIPENYSDFNYNFENYNGTPIWVLNWRSPGATSGEMSVRMDGTTGEVLGMYQMANPAGKAPTLNREQALEKAKAFLEKQIPQQMSQLELLPEDTPSIRGPISPLDTKQYNFSWQRKSKGIPFPNNRATVVVDSVTGAIITYDITWNKEELPDPSGAISVDAAQKAFTEAQMLKAEYLISSPYNPISGQAQETKTQLVYTLSNTFNGAIDALTGKPVPTEFNGMPPYVGGDGMMMDGMGSSPKDLTPQEQEKVEQSSQYISQEKAVESAKKWLDIPSEMILRSANLSENWLEPSQRMWSLDWSSDYQEGMPHSLSAQVNASTGELSGFALFLGEPTGTPAINRDEAQVLAEAFLKKIQPQRFQETALQSPDNNFPMAAMGDLNKQPMQYFNYVRLANGIEVPNNQLSVTVNTVTKAVSNYNMNWSSKPFPSTEGILSYDKAVEAYLKNLPLTLQYTLEPNFNGPPSKVRLVYQPSSKSGFPSSNLIDAKTGVPVDMQGNPINIEGRKPFIDLEKSFGQEEINSLGKAGLFREYGDSFHPEESVTTISLLRAMVGGKEMSPYGMNLTDKTVIEIAKNRGWTQEELDPQGTITRQFLARMMVRLVDLQKAAEIKGIYRLDFTDAAQIAPESAGYVAIAKGLGIVNGGGNLYQPLHTVTRAEAAVALYRALRIQ